jgi:hypothetical protein
LIAVTFGGGISGDHPLHLLAAILIVLACVLVLVAAARVLNAARL